MLPTEARAYKSRSEKKARDKRAALEQENAALVISQAQEIDRQAQLIARLQTTVVSSSATSPPPPVQGAAAEHISPHMRNTGLIPHIPGLMELAAASRKRKKDSLESIRKMSEDDLKDITTAVKERMEVVKPSKKKVKK